MDLETRRKISRSMKGKSNFEGKRHTHATKLQIGFSQEGHRNAAGHKWTVDKETGKEHRVTGDKPKGSRWGRTNRFSQWIHAKENFQDGRNPEDKGDMARHGLKNKTMAQLKKVRSSDTATPRQKQLAHWYINMHKEETITEAKATMCGRCGTKHVRPQDGGTCPALSKERNAALREQEVWDKPSPVKNSTPLSSSMKARAKARAKAAGRRYPNMVDNMWAARNEDTPADRLMGTTSLAMKYLKDTPGQGRKKMTKKLDEANPIDVPAYKRKPLTLDTLRKALTKDKMGNDKISHPDVLAKNRGVKEDTVNELKKSTLASYTRDAALDSTRLGNTLGRAQQDGGISGKEIAKQVGKKIGNRLDGIRRATFKLQK